MKAESAQVTFEVVYLSLRFHWRVQAILRKRIGHLLTYVNKNNYFSTLSGASSVRTSKHVKTLLGSFEEVFMPDRFWKFLAYQSHPIT